MKFQIIFLSLLVMLYGAVHAQVSVDYGRSVIVTATAKCPEGQSIKDQWFSLFGKLGMEPSATITISATPDGAVNSTALTYSGKKSGVTSSAVVASVQREITSLAASTLCKTSLQINQIASGS